MKKNVYKIIGVLIFFLLVSCLENLTEWEYKTKLPPAAAEINEWEMGEGRISGPDFFYILKARINEMDFLLYCNEFSLTPHTADRVYTDDLIWLSWAENPTGNIAWWDVSHSLEYTCVHQENDVWTYAKYENGYLYLISKSH